MPTRTAKAPKASKAAKATKVTRAISSARSKSAAAPARKTARKSLPIVEGPIYTRRLGTVLLVNLGNRASRNCTWSCTYCPWRSKWDHHEKPVFADVETVVSEIAARLIKSQKVESVLLSGDSEPTSHPEFPEIVEAILNLRNKSGGKWRLNCMTNGSRLDDKRILGACNELDETWVKLDCARDQLFKAANHAAKSDTVEKHIKRIRKLTKPMLYTTFWRYPKKEDAQNWNADNLLALLDAYQEIQPKRIHITSLKPTSVSDKVQPVPHESLEAFGLRVEELGIAVEVF